MIFDRLPLSAALSIDQVADEECGGTREQPDDDASAAGELEGIRNEVIGDRADQDPGTECHHEARGFASRTWWKIAIAAPMRSEELATRPTMRASLIARSQMRHRTTEG